MFQRYIIGQGFPIWTVSLFVIIETSYDLDLLSRTILLLQIEICCWRWKLECMLIEQVFHNSIDLFILVSNAFYFVSIFVGTPLLDVIILGHIKNLGDEHKKFTYLYFRRFLWHDAFKIRFYHLYKPNSCLHTHTYIYMYISMRVLTLPNDYPKFNLFFPFKMKIEKRSNMC